MAPAPAQTSCVEEEWMAGEATATPKARTNHARTSRTKRDDERSD